MSPQLPFKREELKRLFKEALKEWLDEKYLELGRWSLMAFFAGLVAAACYFMIWANGWKK